MNPIFRELEIKQRKIDSSTGPECIGKLRKIVVGNANWDLYYYPRGGYCFSIAKPESGASDSVYGKPEYIRQQIKTGRINPHNVTKYGRKVLGL